MRCLPLRCSALVRSAHSVHDEPFTSRNHRRWQDLRFTFLRFAEARLGGARLADSKNIT